MATPGKHQLTRVNRHAVAFLILWNLIVLAALGLLLPELRYQLFIWQLKPDEQWSLKLLLVGYALSACASLLFRTPHRPLSIAQQSLCTLAIFCIILLYILVTKATYSPIFVPLVLVAALVSVPLGPVLSGLRWRAAVLVAGIAAVAVIAFGLNRHKGRIIAAQPRVETSITRTAFYNVSTTSYINYIPWPAVAGGGVSRIGDGYLLATGDGFLYLLGWDDSDALSVKPLPYRVPLNGDEFAKDTTGGPWRSPKTVDPLFDKGEDAGSTVLVQLFRTSGILVQEQGEHVRVFASHYYWKHDASCWVERVSLLEGSHTEIAAGDKRIGWRTIFETSPCLPIKGEGRRRGTPFCGHFGGGRMVMRDPDTLLLTVGDFGFNGVASKWMASQDMSSSYGKAILIHLKDNSSEIFSSGLRNPQGLYMDPNGKIWETEHGPQGGDELNLLQHGMNYGWPIVTYGVDYGTFAWPLNPQQGEHEGFEAPYFSWLPDIGVSDLIGIEHDLFPTWKGDLLVTSMSARTIFRTRIRANRVVYTEPIVVGKHIRDITEARDGRVVLWEDDDNTIAFLRPAIGNSGEVAFATYCSGCHKVSDGTSHRIGPDLWGVTERKVASADGYPDYSPALRRFGGQWTPDRVSEFIKNPHLLVPGTAMEFGGLADSGVRASIVEYLRHAPKVISK